MIRAVPVPQRLVLVAGCVAALIGAATAASAHSTLVEATPGQGERVASLDEIVLRFGDPIVEDPSVTVLALQAPDGTDIAIGRPEHVDPFTLRATVPHTPEPGSYVVRYQVLSSDGDLNDGGHLFDVEPDAAANENAPIVLLSVGGVAVLAMVALLRPRRSRDPGRSDGAHDDGAVI